MDATNHSQDEHAGFWGFGNILLAAVFGGSALIFGSALLFEGLMSGNAEKPKTATPAPAAAAAAPAAPAASGDGQDVTIKTSVTNPLAYDTTGFTVKAGKKVRVTFNDDSVLPHNLIICKPGTKDKVLQLAGAMITDPNGLAKGYIPESPDILAHTKLLMPKESQTLEFDSLAPGEYPYFCSFPGHAIIMNGLMKVE